MTFLTDTVFTCLKNNSIYNGTFLENSDWKKNYPSLFNNEVLNFFLWNGFVS